MFSGQLLAFIVLFDVYPNLDGARVYVGIWRSMDGMDKREGCQGRNAHSLAGIKFRISKRRKLLTTMLRFHTIIVHLRRLHHSHRLNLFRTFASCICYVLWATLTRRLDMLRSTLWHPTSTGSISLSHLGNLFADAFGSSSITLWALGGLNFSMSLESYDGIFSMHCDILAAWLCSPELPATIVDR